MNVHEFEDKQEEGINLEVQEHDVDTPIKALMHASEQGDDFQAHAIKQRQPGMPQSRGFPAKRKVMMNRKTWQKLKKPNQDAWDKITQDGKEVILTYASSRGSKPSGNMRRANVHEFVDNEDTPNVEAIALEDTQGDLQASTHQMVEPKTPEVPVDRQVHFSDAQSKINKQTKPKDDLKKDIRKKSKKGKAKSLLELATTKNKDSGGLNSN